MLPKTHKALVQEEYGKPFVVKDVPTPQATTGSAIIQVLAAPIISYAREIYNGKRKYAYPTPITPGSSAIGRIAAVGPDAVLLKEGDLIFFDCTIRARDDDSAIILSGIAEGSSAASRKLISGEWRDSTFAEYAKIPLENAFRLDENKLCRGLGYDPAQLTWLMYGLVSYGGLHDINLSPGETVIIAPATGGFGSAAVVVALAMGARVIAMGRNKEALDKTKALGDRVEIVRMTGDVESEIAALTRFGKADAFFDISPAAAQNSTHFKSAILSLRAEGRVSLMGGLLEDLALPHRFIMRHNITLKGKWMYTRDDPVSFLRLVNVGILDFSKIVQVLGEYKLEEWEKALDAAWNTGRLGEMVVFAP